MDTERPAYNPHLQRVLKSFQSAAIDSLRGPSSYSSNWKPSQSDVGDLRRTVMSVKDSGLKMDSMIAQQLQQQAPVFMSMDTSSVKSDTTLEGKTIACFVVGGEKRLCLPQVLQTVLRQFTMNQVMEACSDLHIFLSRCNPDQLQYLKMTGNLPSSAQSCGLVTKTDAERLCNKLLHSKTEQCSDPLTPNSFKVYHECFGKSKGIIIPELYNSPDAKCIKCADCYGLFNPEKFVGHSHKALENRTCHWGFDPANWRCYLHLAKDQDQKESLQAFLEEIKGRYCQSYKRKESPVISERDHGSEKKPRFERYYDTSAVLASSGKPTATPGYPRAPPHPAHHHARDDVSSNSPGSTNFRPWSPHLASMLQEGKGGLDASSQHRAGSSSNSTSSSSNHMVSAAAAGGGTGCNNSSGKSGELPSYLQHNGPPKLLNPERVIPFDDQKSYERHFAPNVSLAPVPLKKQKCKEFAREEEMKAKLERCRRDSYHQQGGGDISDCESVSTHSETSVPTTPNDAQHLSSSSSSLGKSAPLQSLSAALPRQEELNAWRDKELAMFKQALSLSPDESGADKKKDVLLDKYVKLRAQTEESVTSLINVTKDLQLEACDAQATSAQMTRELEVMQRQVAQYRIQLSASHAKAAGEKAARQHYLDEVKRTYRQQLNRRESQYSEMHSEMLRELLRLRDELRKVGKNVPDIAYDFELMGECPTLSTPPTSPLSAAAASKLSGTTVDGAPSSKTSSMSTKTNNCVKKPCQNDTAAEGGNSTSSGGGISNSVQKGEILVKTEFKEEKVA